MLLFVAPLMKSKVLRIVMFLIAAILAILSISKNHVHIGTDSIAGVTDPKEA